MITGRGRPPGRASDPAGGAAIGSNQKGLLMSLPEKGPKEYLQLTEDGGQLILAGESQHVRELEALFRQRGVPCTRATSRVGREVLRLGRGADRATAQAVLDGYKAAKGS